MSKPDINHEDIKLSQRQASAPYAEGKPSEVKDVWWIYANRKVGSYPAATEQSGKWLVFIPTAQVDEVWAIIKQATEEGKLGDSSKVATAASNRYDSSERVICVYTYDWTDEKDVRQVRAELRKLGITRKIAYKSDEDTLSGKYRMTGHTKISKYYE